MSAVPLFIEVSFVAAAPTAVAGSTFAAVHRSGHLEHGPSRLGLGGNPVIPVADHAVDLAEVFMELAKALFGVVVLALELPVELAHFVLPVRILRVNGLRLQVRNAVLEPPSMFELDALILFLALLLPPIVRLTSFIRKP